MVWTQVRGISGVRGKYGDGPLSRLVYGIDKHQQCDVLVSTTRQPTTSPDKFTQAIFLSV